MAKETKTICADGWVTRTVELHNTAFHTYWLLTGYAPHGELVLERLTYIQPTPATLTDFENNARLRYAETEYHRGKKLVQ